MRWLGRVVTDEQAFCGYICGPVRARIRDDDSNGVPFASELRALATTGMATQFLEKLLNSAPSPQGWEIGEALAECVVAQDDAREVVWPWNTVRDRRTPRASLPGADLVGFCRQDSTVLLVFGEVKTSSDTGVPPGVMNGGSGMTWQLQEDATRLDIQHSLLRWLRSRCTSPEHVGLYRSAVQRYLKSRGKEILLVGVLLRDTPPHEDDVRCRALALAARLASETSIEVVAWYLPLPIDQWPALLDGGRP